MASYKGLLADFTNVAQRVLDPKLVRIRREKAQPWRKMFKVNAEPLTGQQYRIGVEDLDALRAQARPLGGALGEHRKTTTDEYLIDENDLASFTVSILANTEYMRLQTADQLIGYMEREIGSAERSHDRQLDMELLCDQYGTRAVVGGKAASPTADYSQATSAWIWLDRTAVGSLGRIQRGEELAIHAAAAKEVRKYVVVDDIMPAQTLGTGQTKGYDAIHVTMVGVTQTGRSLGDDGDGANHLDSVTAGDYIRTVGGAVDVGGVLTGYHMIGLDGIAAGTNTDYFGVNQTTAGKGWSKPHLYPVSGEFKYEFLDSALESHAQFCDPGDTPAVLRVHPSMWRSIKALADAKLYDTRPVSENPKSPIAQWGWTGMVFKWAGKDIGLWEDRMQSHTVADLLPAGQARLFEPANKMNASGFNTDPDSGSMWFNVGAVSGTSVVPTFEYRADRCYWGAMIWPNAQRWLRITGITIPGYTQT